jgi:MinD-like ATPase involved in chromosome partitioning or flagellar assembly
MLIACWSVKGGSGTTVVAAALALRLARSTPGVVLADLAGDVPAALGCPEPDGPGLAEWAHAGADVAPDGLERIAVDMAPGLAVLPTGDAALARTATVADGERLVAALRELHHGVAVVDCGVTSLDVAFGVITSATRSLLVVRPCFLALRRALALPIRPSAAVLVNEPDRTLHADDVEDVLGVPVLTVPFDPAVARAVDAGLLATRVPAKLDRALKHAA